MEIWNDWLNIDVTPVFLNNWKSVSRIIINRGWTRSSKTYSLLQLFLYRLLNWRVDEHRYFKTWILTIARKYSASLEKSVQRDFEEIIDSRGVRDRIEILKQSKTYKFAWRIVEFIGADDEQKIKSSKRDILYCNEWNELSYRKQFFQLFIRTKYKCFIDFNPDDEDIRINRELEQKRRIEEKDVDVIVSTYKDNPFLEELQIREIERLASVDPMYYQIYWLWMYWKLEWLIFPNMKQIDEIPKEAQHITYWMDFWFVHDPTALIRIYKRNKALILDELIYETWLTNPWIAKKLTDLWIQWHEEIRADSSEPKSIEEISQAWFNIFWVTKWPDSIIYWVNTMKEYDIYITSRSFNLLKEFKKYVWAKDKDWNSVNKPIDKDNHWIDGARYWIMMKLWLKQRDWDILFW